MQDHEGFIKDQFRILRKKHQLRDVVLHTSFFEAIIVDTAGLYDRNSAFKKGLQKLGLEISDSDESISNYFINSEHKGDLLIEINSVRVKRNELLHDIIKKRLPQFTVREKIEEMGTSIKDIYNKSPLIIDYFITHYDFDPRELLNK